MRLLALSCVVAFTSFLPGEVLIVREADDEGGRVIREVGSDERMEAPSRRRDLRVAEVAAPGINCVSDLDCRITPLDTTDPITLPSASGRAFLQSRTLPIGEPGTAAEGFHTYEYRIDLSGMVGGPSAPCIEELSLEFGLMMTLDYDDDGRHEQAYVVTRGVSPGVAPTTISSDGRTLWVTFDPPLCAGENSLFFGLASPRPPRSTEAVLTDTRNETQSLAARTPDARPSFVRGDSDSSGAVQMSDGLVTLNYLFSAGAAPSCLDAADVNASGSIELTDAIALFDWLFLGGDSPPAPTPSAPEYLPSDCTYEVGTELGCERPSRTCLLRDFSEFAGIFGRVEEMRGDEDAILLVEVERAEEAPAEEEAPPEEEEAPPEGDEGVPVEGRAIDVLRPEEALPPVKRFKAIDVLSPFVAL